MIRSTMSARFLVLLTGLALAATAQRGGGRGIPNPEEGATPQQGPSDIARAKADREQNLKDAARLTELAAKVKVSLDGSSAYALPAGAVRDLEEIEKVSKKLRSRLKAVGAHPSLLPLDDVTTTGRGR